MMKRQLEAAGLPGHFSKHPFRVVTVTDLVEQKVPPKDVQQHPPRGSRSSRRTYRS
jgi:hypothetical protein